MSLEDIPLEDDYCFGGVGRIGNKVLLVENRSGSKLGFLKGHYESKDTRNTLLATVKATVAREIMEESGFTAQVLHKLGVFDRPSTKPNGDPVHKYFNIFLVQFVAYEFNPLAEERAVLAKPELAIARMLPEDAEFLRQHEAAIMAAPDALVPNPFR